VAADTPTRSDTVRRKHQSHTTQSLATLTQPTTQVPPLRAPRKPTQTHCMYKNENGTASQRREAASTPRRCAHAQHTQTYATGEWRLVKHHEACRRRARDAIFRAQRTGLAHAQLHPRGAHVKTHVGIPVTHDAPPRCEVAAAHSDLAKQPHQEFKFLANKTQLPSRAAARTARTTYTPFDSSAMSPEAVLMRITVTIVNYGSGTVGHRVPMVPSSLLVRGGNDS
jgi:erythromycin esterase-like protein